VSEKGSIIHQVLEEVYPYLDKVDEVKEILYRFEGGSVEELVRYLNLHIIASSEPLKTDLRIFLRKLKEIAGLT